jgi:hypothetical protein
VGEVTTYEKIWWVPDRDPRNVARKAQQTHPLLPARASVDGYGASVALDPAQGRWEWSVYGPGRAVLSTDWTGGETEAKRAAVTRLTGILQAQVGPDGTPVYEVIDAGALPAGFDDRDLPS